MAKSQPSISEIRARLKTCDIDELNVLEHALEADTRKSVVNALKQARRRIENEASEIARVDQMYENERSVKEEFGASCIVGLDEVGRGPLAGPLCVGAVILNLDSPIYGLNDSKKLSEKERASLASTIKENALGYSFAYVEPEEIDVLGITQSLKKAFSSAVSKLDEFSIDLILLDGNPLHFDSREKNFVKGDARFPSIAAASIIAKVARDELMTELADQYPDYGFESNKGYGTFQHRCAIEEKGLSPIHRKSFCTEFLQEKLF